MTRKKKKPYDYYLLCKIVARADKEEVADNVSDHLLVQVTIVNVLPVRVLQMMEYIRNSLDFTYFSIFFPQKNT